MRPRRVAVIDEARCIGCTLCIQACPFDAILGARQQMHTVLAELCTGCDLCVAPCPVDCIVMQPATGVDAAWDRSRTLAARDRARARKLRLASAEAGHEARPAQTGTGKFPGKDSDGVIVAAVRRARARRAAASVRVRRSEGSRS